MASYVAMEPPSGAGGAKDRVVLVRDGFHILAFLVPALWLLFHRLWIEALAIIAISMALAGAGSAAGLGNAAPALSLLVSLYVGLEGPALRLAALRRRGWHERGVIDADDEDEAEIRYLAGSGDVPEEAAAMPPAAASVLLPPGSSRMPAGPALGLFALPKGR